MNIRILPIILFCLIGFKANSQSWTNYTTTNVIEDSVINNIYIDTQKNIWISTKNGGLSKFDGYEWSRLDSPDKKVGNDIRGVDEDLKKFKWFASYGTGVFSYGLSYPITPSSKPEWTFFTPNKTGGISYTSSYTDGYNKYTYVVSDSMVSDKITCVLIDAANQKWFGTSDTGIVRVKGSTYPYIWENINKANGLADNNVYASDYFTTNRWFATNAGLSHFNNTNWFKYDKQGKSKFDAINSTWSIVDSLMILNDTVVKFIKIDLSGKKWLATNNGVYSFDDVTFKKYTVDSGLVSNQVNSIYIDNSNSIYFVSSTGIAIYDQTDSTWQTINTSNTSGLVCNNALCIMPEANGNKWFGTDNGLYYYDGKIWTNYKKLSVLGSHNIWSTAVDKQNVKWFGTYGAGVFKYDGTNWTNYNTGNGLADSIVLSIAIDNSNNKWFGTNRKGLSKFNGTSFTNYTHYNGLAGDCVYSIKIDNSGVVWLGTGYGNGVSKLSGSSFTNYGYVNGVAFNDVHAIAIDSKGYKWFGTYGGGVTIFTGSTWETLDMSDGLVDNYVQSIAIDINGTKWIATRGGLSSYNDSIFTNYLIGENVWDVKVDESNIVWAGTWGSGLRKFDGTTWTSYGTKWVDTLNTIGLADNRVNSFLIDNNGVKYVGTWKGISVLNDGGTKNYEIQQSSQLVENNITNVNIYPIPVNSELTVDYAPINVENCFVEVFDVLGKQISSEQIFSSETKLNFNNLDRGVYMLRINDGDSKFLQKIVKN
ncbi:MAG: hypothetical protein A2033_02380 [Bacteroidetes bacterium GWA2_31_9]|nr:MAG: hypothetical protein A2033_02380 [Bacteroidetes bacterium GWA2_31_9]